MNGLSGSDLLIQALTPSTGRAQGRPETCGRPGEANNLTYLQTAIFKTFSVYDGANEISEQTCQYCAQFSEGLFGVWKYEFSSTIFPITPVTS